MFRPLSILRRHLAAKLILGVGLTLAFSITAWTFFNIHYQKQKMMDGIMVSADRLVNTIRLGTNYAMMLNSRDDINQIIRNVGRQKGIDKIRIYNKDGQIKFSNAANEVDRRTNIKDEACYVCHRSDPPQQTLDLEERIRIMADGGDGSRRLGIISPIYNEPSCATDRCHFHPADKRVLGAIDLVISLAETDEEIYAIERGMAGLAGILFLLTSTIIFLLVLRFVNHPVKRLIAGTRAIAKGAYDTRVNLHGQEDELGHLADAIHRMGGRIGEHQKELERQRDKYHRLFNLVPCLITVNDRDFRLIAFNREFQETFDPPPGEYCYRAYKGRDQPCKDCPVARTFDDGQSHASEETGVNKDGSTVHWLVRTSPVHDQDGRMVAAIEISLDITERKQLEERLRLSESKYHTIFNSIPNPVFVVDQKNLEILDCNDSSREVYGYRREELVGRPLSILFGPSAGEEEQDLLRSNPLMNHVRHFRKTGEPVFVRVRVVALEYPGRKVLLVTTSDKTKQLETEQQLIQTSKMATLGEMATGVAHELNQPLAVIKSASNFFVKKIDRGQAIEAGVLRTMAAEIDRHVDRASKIINHMREFGRKSDMTLSVVDLNRVIGRAFEIFHQQLKVRGIAVAWDLAEDPAAIMAEADRLEQVFINLLLNARDAIEALGDTRGGGGRQITLRTRREAQQVVAEVCDNGIGIARKNVDKIFDPFFTTKPVGKGTGLGLSISYGIVKDCGGTVTVRSEEGAGTCFTLCFPAASPEGEDAKAI